jgi:uncharacterized protein YcbK (DUF882 family)
MTSDNSRRRAIALGLGALGATGFARGLWARGGAASQAEPSPRTLELKNLHTGQVMTVTFDRSAGPDAASLAKLQYFLRDYRVNEEHPIDVDLYGLLSDLAQSAGYDARYEVISGYRSPRTNSRLHAEGHGVAEHSLHMEGRAIDVRLLGCDLEKLRDVALMARRGGVGFYPSSNFVHVDTGRVRTWTGR